MRDADAVVLCRCCTCSVHPFQSKVAVQGIPWEVFKAARKPITEAHNRQETLLFAKSIERHAFRDK